MCIYLGHSHKCHHANAKQAQAIYQCSTIQPVESSEALLLARNGRHQ